MPPEPVMADRTSSSVAILSRRVSEVGRAIRERDETAARTELAALAEECRLLSRMTPLWPPRGLEQRQRVAIERDPSGRMN